MEYGPSGRAASGAWNQPSGWRCFDLDAGRVRISYLPDGQIQLWPLGWLKDSDAAYWSQRPEATDDGGWLVASCGGLLVEVGSRALLIDAGFGPLARPPEGGDSPVGAIDCGRLVGSFATAGVDPGAVEMVAFTHLHPDHVGWAAPARDGFSSPLADAVWVAAAEEIDEHLRRHGELPLDGGAERVRRVADGEEIFPGVSAVALPGHTAGHLGYAITAGGVRIVVIGDAMHSPAQVEHPEWRAASDWRADLAVDTRRRMVEQLRADGSLCYAVHFGDAVFGRVARRGAALAWMAEDPGRGPA
ncbi:MAG TPA: MBL fold metallo-hydrolase [Thermoleophilia bacterium]|nr:MBL fold metallo-hydrolase [Thermoleophilia bacterium]